MIDNPASDNKNKSAKVEMSFSWSTDLYLTYVDNNGELQSYRQQGSSMRTFYVNTPSYLTLFYWYGGGNLLQDPLTYNSGAITPTAYSLRTVGSQTLRNDYFLITEDLQLTPS